MIIFSKKNLLVELENQIAKMEKIWKFVPTNGTNQIKDRSDFDRIVAYGEYNTLLGLHESIKDGFFLN
jgi:hypothetical protein